MPDEVAIAVNHVSKTFRLPHEKQTSIKGALINLARGGRRSFEAQQVLKDISFEVKKGEFFGIVGRNGSGKSTLLKMLAGIYSATEGGISINGKLTPFIELGVGFNPELTGRENVYLNGALLGFNRKEMDSMYDDIVSFAELSRFMDQKLKNYSSGMQVRLAFSIAIRAKSDILLIDEVLAVGDAAFQQKCFTYFEQLKKDKRTIVLVSHDMASMQRFCDRILVIDRSKQIGLYDATEGSAVYTALNYAQEARSAGKRRRKEQADKKPDDNEQMLPYKGTIIQSVVLNAKNAINVKKIPLIKVGDRLDITVAIDCPDAVTKDYAKLLCSIGFHDETGIHIGGMNSGEVALVSTSKKIVFTVARSPFPEGVYELRIGLFGQKSDTQFDLLDYTDSGIYFSGYGVDKGLGTLLIYGDWSAQDGTATKETTVVE